MNNIQTIKWQPVIQKILIFYVVGLAVFTLLFAIVSLRWRIVHDSPLMLYAGFLMDRFDLMPYRDFFEMNPPGTFFINWLLFHIVQFSDLRFRLVDLTLLAILSVLSWSYLRGLTKNATVAIISPLLFAITYLGLGQVQSMQREYIALIPVAISLNVAFRFHQWSLTLRSFMIGILMGIAVSIKPHLGLAFPVILGGMLLQGMNLQRPLRAKLIVFSVGKIVFSVTAGGLLIIGLITLYLLYNKMLADFLDIATNYWPLYSTLDGTARVHSHFTEAVKELDVMFLFQSLRAFRFYGLIPIGFFLSFWMSWQYRHKLIEVIVLHLLLICFLVYIWIGNKYWVYHTIPLFFILTLIAGCSCWYKKIRNTTKEQILLTGLIIYITFISLPVSTVYAEYLNVLYKKHNVIKNGDVDQITSFLKKNMDSGDSVLPLDVTGGAVHGMYLAQAKLGSSFIYDFHFYHHCSSIYIQTLRRRLIQSFQTIQPRFVIQFQPQWRPSGNGTCKDFLELQSILDKDYAIVLNSKQFQILKRRNVVKIPTSPL
jgi:hypothetical protein